jgi:RNA polymerase sigma factor (sigma-70 family)
VVSSLHLTPEEQMLLAARVERREQGAEDELVELFGKRIRTMMLVRLRDTHAADDLTQDTLMAVLLALRAGRLRASDRLAAFVYGVARNVLGDHLRGTRTRSDVPISPELFPAYSVDHVAEKERETLVRSALESLPEAERQILVLTLVEGLKPGAIAQRLGLSPDVCRTRKTRALKKMVAEVERLSHSGGTRDHPGGADEV